MKEWLIVDFQLWVTIKLFIAFNQKMARKRIKGTKYNKVSKQQKYIFLHLCIAEQKSIHEAAFYSGIHYSTAKTILFFHKKNYKNYNSFIVNTPEKNQALTKAPRATYAPILISLENDSPTYPRIEVISSFSPQQYNKRKSRKSSKESTDLVKQECLESDMVKLEEEFLELQAQKYVKANCMLGGTMTKLQQKQQNKKTSTQMEEQAVA